MSDRPWNHDRMDRVFGDAEQRRDLTQPLPDANGQEPEHALAAIPRYPVDALPQRARALMHESGLPDALVGGSVLAALAGAIGGNAEVVAGPTWTERAILWVVNIAPRGAGKSPAQRLAFGPLRDHDALGDDADAPASIRIADLTTEALARALHARGGAAAVDLDELAVMLRGFGEYKRGGGGDRGRLLALWGGDPWVYERVGGGTATNKISLSVGRPTLVICGSLQTPLHELLGGEEDGLRPRWLPHLSPMPQGVARIDVAGAAVTGWATLIDVLIGLRDRERRWTLSAPALVAFDIHRRRWQGLAQGRDVGASVAAAAVKAPGHLLRVALVLAEAEGPGQAGSISADVLGRAAAIVDFTLGCWAALPEQGAAEWLSRRDAGLDRGVTKLVAWLEERGGEATKREIERAHVAGVRRARDLDHLLDAYEANFPGCVTEQRNPHGSPTKVVRAPVRTPYFKVSPSGDTLIGTDENPRGRGENPPPGSGDTLGGDTLGGDTLGGDTSTDAQGSDNEHGHAGGDGRIAACLLLIKSGGDPSGIYTDREIRLARLCVNGGQS